MKKINAAEGGARGRSEARAQGRMEKSATTGPQGNALVTPQAPDISPPFGDLPGRNLRRARGGVNEPHYGCIARRSEHRLAAYGLSCWPGPWRPSCSSHPIPCT